MARSKGLASWKFSGRSWCRLRAERDTFPARDHRRGQAVSQHVHRGARHVHERIDAENERHTFRREVEAGHRRSQDHERGAGHVGDALTGQHQCQHHQELRAERQMQARGLGHEDRGQTGRPEIHQAGSQRLQVPR